MRDKNLADCDTIVLRIWRMQFCWKLVDPFPVFLVRLNRNDKGLLMSIQNLSGLNDSTTRHDNNKVGMQSHKVGLFGL